MSTSTKSETTINIIRQAAEKGEIVQVPVELITLVTDKSHPLYDKRVEDKLSSSFVESVGNDGMDQNIRLVLTSGDELLVAAGRSRFQAAMRLGVETVPAKITLTDSGVEMKKIMIRENEQRRDDNTIRKALKLRGLYEELRKEHLEKFPEGKVITELDPKAMNSLAQEVFGVGKRRIQDYELLAFETSPKVLQAAEKDKISPQIAIEIASRFPNDFPKQEKLLVKALATDKGKVKKENFDPIGQRPVKAKELIELGESAYISSKVTVPVKLFARFLSGKMQESEREEFIAKHDWAELWISGEEPEEETSSSSDSDSEV